MLEAYKAGMRSREIQERIVAGTVMPELAFINAKLVMSSTP